MLIKIQKYAINVVNKKFICLEQILKQHKQKQFEEKDNKVLIVLIGAESRLEII